MIWKGVELSKALDKVIDPDLKANNVVFNSQEVDPGDIFVALTCGQRDGHIFVNDALNRGASLAIVSQIPDEVKETEKLIFVEDTYQALLDLAKYKRNNVKAKYIAITGSNGKTSTKEALYKALSKFGNTHKNIRSFNNYLGIPLTLASMPNYAEYVILEIGMNHPGEILELSKLINPDIVTITNINSAHIGFFDSIKDIADAKSEVFEYLCPNGHVTLCQDDQFYDYLFDKASKKSSNILSFGVSSKANSKLISYQVDNDLNSNMMFRIGGKETKLNTELIGSHQALNISNVLLIANQILGLDLELCTNALQNLEPFEKRGEVIKIKVADKNITIVHDAYNANPESTKQSIKNFLFGSKNVLVLADMLELGEDAAKYHKDLSRHILESDAYKLITVGSLMKNLHNEMIDFDNKYHFDNANLLEKELMNILDDGDLVLFKGSKGTKLYITLEKFIAQNTL